MTTKQSQETDFTRDVLGRYICNGMDEALASTNPNGQRQPSNNLEEERRRWNWIDFLHKQEYRPNRSHNG